MIYPHAYRPKRTGLENDYTTERYQTPHDYEAPPPADYEVFKPTSVTTITSNIPLLDTDPQPYEVLEKYTRQTRGDLDTSGVVYETVKNSALQDNERGNSSVDGHIYFTLESREDIK